MNRKIIFRGKASNMLYNGADILHQKGDWLYGDLIHQDGKCFIAPVDKRYPYGTSFLSFVVDAETVGQFTGVVDEDFIDIYEGDLLRYKDKLYRVSEEFGSFCIVESHTGEGFDEYGQVNDLVLPLIHIYAMQDVCDSEIIYKVNVQGNIHDNPELLTDKDQ